MNIGKILGVAAGLCLILGLISQVPGAPTKIDLKTQSQNADFSLFPLLSIPTNTTLPGSCSIGQVFFLSTAIAGQNIYGCTSSNTWTLQSAGTSGGGGGGALTLPLPVTFISTTLLHIGTGSAQCVHNPINYPSIGGITLSSGSGSAYIYIDCANSSLPLVGIPSSGMAVSCSNCASATGITGFPSGSIPLSVWVASSGSWLSTGSDVRNVLVGGYVEP